MLTPVFRPGLKEIKSSLLRLKRQIKRCLANLFLSYSFGIEPTIRSYTPVDSFLKNHTRLQAKMSRVYTRLRTERGNIPPIWPVCKEHHPRPRRLYLSYLFTGCPVTFAKTVPCDHTQPQPQMETFWNTLGGRLEIDRNKVYFYARRTSSLCGCRSEEGRTTAHAGLGWIHVRKTRHRFLNMLRLLCLTLTLDFSFVFCLLLHFLAVFIF